MRPSKITKINCMEDLRRCKEGIAIKRPSTKGSFEIYLGKKYEPGADCCMIDRYDPVVIRKQNGTFIETQIIDWLQPPKDMKEGISYYIGESKNREIHKEDNEYERYDSLWKEAITQ